uniref:Uncharacterized protein n=1 Tax=Haptolina brevifila TaxID=156173 RepID=A0A7S2CD60_9EUKA|mmetsp:Transcript_23388/g.46719  ORF Transcript_23388/g.46719 Transcript_23388/m.46719 type:complete len:231 (+) Transcript_23388:978-1670(+)
MEAAADLYCPLITLRVPSGVPSPTSPCSYAALHKVARALEDPFVHPPNDLPANALQAAFNLRLLTSWEAVRQPADVATADDGAGGSGAQPAIPPSGLCETSGSEEEESLWGEYAFLEAEDVRKATTLFLTEWRRSASSSAQQRGRPLHRCDSSTPQLVYSSSPRARTITSIKKDKALRPRGKSLKALRVGTVSSFKRMRDEEATRVRSIPEESLFNVERARSITTERNVV